MNYIEEYKYLTNIYLNVTDDCNLACKYCFVNQNSHYMSLNTAKAIIDYVVQNLKIKNKTSCYIHFFGGEPLLCYDSIIIPLVQYCKDIYPNIGINFRITTNGTLLTEDKLKFFRLNNFNLHLSIDGAPETQDINRPCKTIGLKSSELLENNISNILKYYPNTTFRSTIYEKTVQNLFINYLYAEEKGFKNFLFIPDRYHKWQEDNKKILLTQISKIYFYRLQQMKENKKPLQSLKDFVFIQYIKYKKNKSEHYNTVTCNRCGFGTLSGAIDYNGDIYGCQEQITKQNTIFKIGNVFNGGIDVKLQQNLINNYIETKDLTILEEKCTNCSLRTFCVESRTCPSASYELFQNFYSATDIDCFYNKLIYANTLLFFSLFYNNYNFDGKAINDEEQFINIINQLLINNNEIEKKLLEKINI